MRSKNQYVAGLALTVLGNIGSVRPCIMPTVASEFDGLCLALQLEMIRDLAAELEQCLQSPNAYIQKKVLPALLCDRDYSRCCRWPFKRADDACCCPRRRRCVPSASSTKSPT